MTNFALLYARVSSKEQEKEGYSIPAQLRILTDHASENNLNIVKSAGLILGISYTG